MMETQTEEIILASEKIPPASASILRSIQCNRVNMKPASWISLVLNTWKSFLFACSYCDVFKSKMTHSLLLLDFNSSANRALSMDKEGKREGQMIAEEKEKEKEKSQISNSTLNHVKCNLIELMIKGNCMHWINFMCILPLGAYCCTVC